MLKCWWAKTTLWRRLRSVLLFHTQACKPEFLHNLYYKVYNNFVICFFCHSFLKTLTVKLTWFHCVCIHSFCYFLVWSVSLFGMEICSCFFPWLLGMHISLFICLMVCLLLETDLSVITLCDYVEWVLQCGSPFSVGELKEDLDYPMSAPAPELPPSHPSLSSHLPWILSKHTATYGPWVSAQVRHGPWVNIPAHYKHSSRGLVHSGASTHRFVCPGTSADHLICPRASVYWPVHPVFNSDPYCNSSFAGPVRIESLVPFRFLSLPLPLVLSSPVISLVSPR